MPGRKVGQAGSDSDQGMIDDLEKTLTKWEGPQAVLPGPSSQGGIEGSGWFGQGDSGKEGGPSTWSRRIKVVALAINGYRDSR